MMIGCTDAINWVARQIVDDADVQDCVVNRMIYQFEKEEGSKAKYHKGKYGSRYDSYTCGNCGHTISEAYWKYCPNCGYRILKDTADTPQTDCPEYYDGIECGSCNQPQMDCPWK